MNINSKLDECQIENYLLKNNCIIWENDENELISNLKFYVYHTGLIENSPWAKNSNVVSHYKNQGLSSLQKRIIQYLHKSFFKHGDPVYMKMQTIANRVQAPKRSIQKAIGRLVERKILLRFYLFTHNSDSKNHERAYLLPNNPLKVKLDNRIKYSHIKRSSLPKNFTEIELGNNNSNLDTKRTPQQGKRTPLPKTRDVRLTWNLQESLQKFRCIVYSIYSINYYYSQLNHFGCFKEKHYISYNVPPLRNGTKYDPLSFSFSDERNKKNMKRIPRYKLSVALPKPKPLLDKTFVGFNELISSVDYNLFNLSDNGQRKNILNHVASHTYDFDFEKLFSEKKLNVRNDTAKKKIRSLLSDYLKLFFSNEPLNYESTDYILKYWNLIDDPHYSKHKINHESNTYTRIMILTNNILKFKYNNDMTKFISIINRIEHFGMKNGWIKNKTGKCTLDDILLFRNNNGLKKYFVKDDKEFDQLLHSYRSKHKEASTRHKEVFIDSFYRDDRKNGEELWRKYQHAFDTSMDEKIGKLKSCKRELYGWNLTQSKIIDGYETPSIMEEYYDWCLQYFKKPGVLWLCNYHNFMQFVSERMWGERGMDKFWNFKHKI
jgi:hypothetical protein